MQISISILVGNANSGISYVKRLIRNFKARVLSYPNSIFEAEPCLDATLEGLNAIGLLDNASLIITPNAYNEGILYDVIPNTTLGDMDVVRATTATRVNNLGIIENVGLNVPRIDYTNVSCPSILVEPQRTNLLLQSNNLNATSWVTVNISKTSGQVSPTSLNNEGWLLNKTATGVDGTVYNGFTIPALSAYTYSWYILKDNNESRFPEFYLRLNSGQVEQYVQMNTKTGSLAVRIASPGCTQSISSSPNNLWWRLTLTNPTPISNLGDNRHGVRPAAGTTLGIYNINATGSVFVYGAQTEQGSYPTSYIPTVASTVTRNADVLLSIASPLLLNDFSIFMDFRLIQNNQGFGYMIFGSVDSANVSWIYIDSGDNMSLTIGGTTNSLGKSQLNINTNYKVCFKRSGSNLKYFRNGVLINTFTVQTDQFKFSTFFNAVDASGNTSKYLTLGNLKTGIAFNTALTDTECITLTTL